MQKCLFCTHEKLAAVSRRGEKGGARALQDPDEALVFHHRLEGCFGLPEQNNSSTCYLLCPQVCASAADTPNIKSTLLLKTKINMPNARASR
jgi:hypothetical protein